MISWTERLPEEVTSVGRLLQLPPFPEIPEPMRGRSFVVVEAAMLTDPAHADELLLGLRELRPEIDTFSTIPANELSRLHMDPDHPVPGVGDHMLLLGVTPEAIEALVLAAGANSGSPLLSVELRHLGGALARRAAQVGAGGTIDAQFALYAVGMAIDESTAQAVDSHLAILTDALTDWDAGRRYLNFVDRPTDPRESFSPENYERLLTVKAAYDPGDLISFPAKASTP